MLHLQKKDKKQNEQVIFIQVAFFAVGAVLLLWYLAPWVLNRILNAGNVLGIAFAVVLLLCGMFAQPVTHLLAPSNHAPGAVVLKDVPAFSTVVGVPGHVVRLYGCKVPCERVGMCDDGKCECSDTDKCVRRTEGLSGEACPAQDDRLLLAVQRVGVVEDRHVGDRDVAGAAELGGLVVEDFRRFDQNRLRIPIVLGLDVVAAATRSVAQCHAFSCLPCRVAPCGP